MMDSDNYWPDIAPPVFILPTDPANVVSLTGFTITLNAFICSSMTHTYTDYEIWSAAGGNGTLIWSAYNDTGLLIKIVPGLAVSTGTRYCRARQTGATGKQSSWSSDKILYVI